MACPTVVSGASFLSSTLGYFDCQAQSLGTFGFQALSAPQSTGAAILFGLLTLFVATFGYRLVLGYPVEGRDVVTVVLKIGIALTLATSWAAYRTLLYDTVLYGPAEIAGQITGASDLSSRYSLAGRLENVDTGILALTVAGTGRDKTGETAATTGGNATSESNPQDSPFAAIAVDDTVAMGFARIAYLAGTLAPLAILRIAAGLLLALGPVFAGLLFFDGARGLFFGWLRALAAVALGSLAMIVSLSVELSLLEPWLTDLLARRQAKLIAPAAPTELVVITVSFAILAFGLVALFGKVAFNPVALMASVRGPVRIRRDRGARTNSPPVQATLPTPPSRAAQIGERLTTIYRGERGLGGDRLGAEASAALSGAATSGGRIDERGAGGGPAAAAQAPVGSSYRRTMRRTSQVSSIRDRRP